MDLAEGVADLHMHTTASDGTDTLDDRVAQAAERGLDAIAITDHDRVTEELTGRSAERDGVTVVTGVEIRADLDDTKVEFLGHFVDPTNDRLQSLLTEVRGYRRERNDEMLARLRDVADIDLTRADVGEYADGMVGRPHIAQALVDRGVVDSIGAAFGTYLGDDCSAYVPMERVPYERALDAIRKAGGVATLAHPGRIRSDRVPEFVATLAEAGLDGIEVWYPYGTVRSDDYAEIGVEDAAALAAEHDLLRTGGSDCHGRGSGKFRIGDVRTPREDFEKLVALADERA
ncbi:PHP domain-containing protein [Haloarculaceae archaeon H-GB1-1]|nr:PHP domain-containing protein [Haloarculaceae archaeon H-GB1-1]